MERGIERKVWHDANIFVMTRVCGISVNYKRTKFEDVCDINTTARRTVVVKANPVKNVGFR